MDESPYLPNPARASSTHLVVTPLPPGLRILPSSTYLPKQAFRDDRLPLYRQAVAANKPSPSPVSVHGWSI